MKNDAWNIDKNHFPTQGDFYDQARFLLRYAILAPSGHNSQPWKVKIADHQIIILPDYDRGRDVVDPKNREMFVSLGAFAKNLELAISHFGIGFTQNVINDRIEFNFLDRLNPVPDDGLFSAITRRSTYRLEFTPQKVDPKVVKLLESVNCPDTKVYLYDQPEVIEKVADKAQHADLVWFKSKHLIKELEEWLRDDVEMAKDGLPTGVINMYKIAAEAKYLFSKDSQQAKKVAAEDTNMTRSSALVAVVATSIDDIDHWINAGRVYEELALTAAFNGLSNGIIGSLVQLTGMRNELSSLLNIPEHIQMVLTIGYPQVKVPSTPRRPLAELLV